MRHDAKIGRTGLAATFFLFASMAVLAQPTVISPIDVARNSQYTTLTSDFSVTAHYDLDNPVELQVVIDDIHMPDNGYTEIVYRVVSAEGDAQNLRLDLTKRYIATLQLTSEVKKHHGKINRQMFRGGVPVTLLGWPATEWNQSNSALLVDEIQLKGSDSWLGFHEPSANMIKHQKSHGPRWGRDVN